MYRSRSIAGTRITSPRRARRAAGLGLWGWALVLQFGGIAAAGALQGQTTCTCTSSAPPELPEPDDSTAVGGGGGGKRWWMFLLPAGAAGLLAGLPGGGSAPGLAMPLVTESTGDVVLPVAPVAAPANVAPVAPVGPKAKSDRSIPLKKDGGKDKPDSVKADTARATPQPTPPAEVPAPLLLGGLGLGAGAWGLLFKKKLIGILSSLG